jgi:hypothetical protein
MARIGLGLASGLLSPSQLGECGGPVAGRLRLLVCARPLEAVGQPCILALCAVARLLNMAQIRLGLARLALV